MPRIFASVQCISGSNILVPCWEYIIRMLVFIIYKKKNLKNLKCFQPKIATVYHWYFLGCTCPRGRPRVQWHSRGRQTLLQETSRFATCSVADVDPSRIHIRLYKYGSGSRSFSHQEKIVRKTLMPTVLWFIYDFWSVKNSVASKNNKQKNRIPYQNVTNS